MITVCSHPYLEYLLMFCLHRQCLPSKLVFVRLKNIFNFFIWMQIHTCRSLLFSDEDTYSFRLLYILRFHDRQQSHLVGHLTTYNAACSNAVVHAWFLIHSFSPALTRRSVSYCIIYFKPTVFLVFLPSKFVFERLKTFFHKFYSEISINMQIFQSQKICVCWCRLSLHQAEGIPISVS